MVIRLNSVGSMLCALVFMAGAAVAEDDSVFKFTKEGSLDGGWNNPASWEGGVVPGANDKVYLGRAGGDGTEYVFLEMPPTAIAVDSFVGATENLNLSFPWSGNRGDLIGVRAFGPWNDLIIPLGGYAWANRRAQCGFELLGDSVAPTMLPNIFFGFAPTIRVPEGKEGEVGNIFNRGFGYKDGAGKLTVDLPLDENIGLYHRGGTLSLKGGTATEVAEDIAPGAYLHLNAADEDSIETSGDSVIAWRDPASGRTAGPVPESWKDGWTLASSFSLPTLDRDHAVNGHPLVRFGVLAGPELVRTVREVFMVIAAEPTADEVMPPLGDYAGFNGRSYHLQRSYSTSDWNNNGLFNFYARSFVKDALLAVNGNPVPWRSYPSNPCELRVVSVAFPDERAFATLGADRNCSSFGGFRVAEFVIYTRELTAAERRQTVSALKRRWLGDGSVHDIGIVKVEADGAEIEVAENEVASVRTVNDMGRHGIVKTGEGTLVLDRVQPNTAKIEVQGGKVAFSRQTAAVAADAQVAADPAFHLDADNAASFTGEGGVTSWHDTRTDVDFQADLYAGAAMPTVAAAAPTGRNVVDFGTQLASNGPRLQFSAVKSVHEGFIVWKNTYPGSSYDNVPAIFESQAFPEFSYNSPGCLFSQYRNNARNEACVWTVNGSVVNPESREFGDNFGGGVGNFVVIHFVSPQPLKLGGVADSANGTVKPAGGGCQVAEYIGYDRLLTDRERQETEAALMKKWLGTDHPSRKGWSGTLAFAEGVTPEIAAESDLTVGTVEAEGTLVKSGEGALKVNAVAPGVTGYDVRGGSLAVQEDIMSDAFFHFDAAAEDSFEYVPNTDKAEISRWNDVRGNGRYAEALVTDIGMDEHSSLLKYPRVGTAAVPGLNEGMPYVDFLKFSRPAGYSTTDTASMRWFDENGKTGLSDIREVHIVYCDDIEAYEANPGSECGAFIGTCGSWSGQAGIANQFLRSGVDANHILVYFSGNTQKALMRMDGEILPRDWQGNGDCYNSQTNLHLHVLSISSTDYALSANAFANDRGNCGAGGYKICEAVIFTGNTNSFEKFSAINDYLCKKWRGIGEGSKFPTSGSFKATAGTLSLASATGAVVQKDNSSLEFVFRGADDYGRIAVDGDFVLPEHGTLTVDLPQRGQPRPELGRYVLLKAKSLIGTENLSGWTVSAETSANYSAKVEFDAANGEIVLEISRKGLVMVIQ